MEIQKVTAPSFRAYGKVLEGYDVARLLKEMEHTPLPMDDVIYIPSSEDLETLPVAKEFSEKGYGGLPIQIGYCNGHNKKLNAAEYHRSSEINVPVVDMVLILGKQQDVEDDFTYDTSKMEAFLIPAGTVVEIYATTLHYAPCDVGEQGFRSVVVLPKDTNTECTFPVAAVGEEKLMTAKNKWLIAHEEAKIEGAFAGLEGENITLDI